MSRYLLVWLVLALPVMAQDPFAPLAEESRPLSTRLQVDFNSSAALGLGYISDDNFRFGQYNGLSEEGAVILGDLDWRGGSANSHWNITGTDLGLDTRNLTGQWRNSRMTLGIEYDGQKQVRNDSGQTPFSGGSELVLPANWVPANVTGGFGALADSLQSFRRELERDIWSLDIGVAINEQWNIDANVQYEDKQGASEVGAAFYIDASAGHAAVIPQDINFETTEADVAVSFQGQKLLLTGSWFYSDFDNNNDLQRWQNPYEAFSPSVNYPAGEGGLGTSPDNTHHQGRLVAVYTFSHKLRLQLDGSYGQTTQDQDFADYTVNTSLRVDEPLQVTDFDGEIETATLDARILYRPLPKLNIEARYHGEEREYSADRNGYRYVPGDAGSQSRSALTVYNTLHDHSKNRLELEAGYRLPWWRSKVWLEYRYQEIERTNAAVETTEEDQLRLRFRVQPVATVSANLKILWGDRAADTYRWHQSYYARLDSELINNTPETQRYNNHPALTQYYLGNRERGEVKLDVNWQPAAAWALSLNGLWREDEYDETQLGLNNEQFSRLSLSLAWTPSGDLSLSAFAGIDGIESEQSGRNFRGGVEKNAFEIYPPLPQASDPARDWGADVEDRAVNLGLNMIWQPREAISLSADYVYVQTESSYGFSSGGAGDIGTDALPDNESKQHHLALTGSWAWRENLSLELNYQYWSFVEDNWAIHGVKPDSIDKVLSLGEQEADENIHYVGVSAVYRWQ